MEYKTVTSSNVAAVGYEAATSTLGVQFLNGSEYHYFSVPERVFNGLVSADSVGKYLDEFVKKAGYRYQRIK